MHSYEAAAVADVAHPSSPLASKGSREGQGRQMAAPSNRGTLTVKDKVAQHLAVRAALDTAGVRTHAGGLDKLTGRELPRVDVSVSGDHVRATVDIAVQWPQPLTTVTAAVRANVTHALSTWAGLTVDGVDVSVAVVVTEPTVNGDIRVERVT